MDADFLGGIDSWYFRLILALILGSILGFERFIEGKPAGLRTIALVCTGSAAFLLIGERILETGAAGADPTRIVQGVITGIGFLGAGTIIQQADRVRGLTSAATVWMTAAVGMACGVGAFDLALFGTLIGIIVLQGYEFFERWMNKKRLRPSPEGEAPGAPPAARPGQRQRRRRRRGGGGPRRPPE